jgi:hypothetical protein
MTEFDFDVITGPSGPMRRGPSACGWTPAEGADAPALPAHVVPALPRGLAPERNQRREAGDA